jgi:hypothetical protein
MRNWTARRGCGIPMMEQGRGGRRTCRMARRPSESRSRTEPYAAEGSARESRGREPAGLRRRWRLQPLRQSAHADRAGLHDADVRPCAAFAQYGHPDSPDADGRRRARRHGAAGGRARPHHGAARRLDGPGAVRAAARRRYAGFAAWHLGPGRGRPARAQQSARIPGRGRHLSAARCAVGAGIRRDHLSAPSLARRGGPGRRHRGVSDSPSPTTG